MISTIKGVARLIRRTLYGDPVSNHVRRGLKIGKNFSLMEEVKLDYSHIFHIEIGDDVTIAPRVHILAHDASTKRALGYTRIGKVTIGDRVFIGASAIILPGVVIGNDVIIAAGSVVSSNIPDGYLVAGNPAQKLCKTEDYIHRKRNEMDTVPCFGADFTIDGGVSKEKIDVMNEKMVDRIGYIV